MKTLLLSAGIIGFGLISSQAADDCPTKETASKGFIVERAGAKTEILFPGNTDVRTVTRVGGRTVLEVTLFQGLFELDRVDRGRRTVYQPKSDLAKISAPAPGKKITALMEETEGQRKGNLRTYVLDVRKQSDTLYVGSCNYKILRIDRSVLDDRSRPVFMHTDYYSPDIRLIVGKEYRDRDGGTELIKYDKIYPTPR